MPKKIRPNPPLTLAEAQFRAWRDVDYRIRLMEEASRALMRGDENTAYIVQRVACWRPWWQRFLDWLEEQRHKRWPSLTFYWDRKTRGPWLFCARELGTNSSPSWTYHLSVGRACAWLTVPISFEKYRPIQSEKDTDYRSIGALRRSTHAWMHLRSIVKNKMTHKEFMEFWEDLKRERDSRPYVG